MAFTLDQIKPYSQWTPEDYYNAAIAQGYAQRENDQGAMEWYGPGADGESRVWRPSDDSDIKTPGDPFQYYNQQLEKAGYAIGGDQLLQWAAKLGLPPDQAAQAIFGQGSQIINDPLRGQLVKAGTFDPNAVNNGWQLPDMEDHSFLSNYGGALLMLPAVGGIAGASAGAAGAGAGASDLGWAANLTDAAGGSLAAPAGAGSAYAGLGGAAGTGAGMSSNFFGDVLNDYGFGENPVMNSIQSDLSSAGAGFDTAAPVFQTAEGTINPAWFSDVGLTMPSWLSSAADLAKKAIGSGSSTGGLFGNGGILGTGLTTGNLAAIAPSLAAIAYARNQSPFDTSKLESIYGGLQGNQSPYLKSLTDPYDENTASGYGKLTQSLQDRGVYGSSFGNMDLNNYNVVRDRGRADILGTGMNNQLTLQSGVASKLLDAQAKQRELTNNLYGSALYALAGGLRPQQSSVFGGR